MRRKPTTARVSQIYGWQSHGLHFNLFSLLVRRNPLHPPPFLFFFSLFCPYCPGVGFDKKDYCKSNIPIQIVWHYGGVWGIWIFLFCLVWSLFMVNLVRYERRRRPRSYSFLLLLLLFSTQQDSLYCGGGGGGRGNNNSALAATARLSFPFLF